MKSLKDRCILDDFESMVIAVLFNESSMPCMMLYDKDEYAVIRISHRNKYLDKNFVLKDSTYQIRKDFISSDKPTDTDIEVIEDKAYLSMYLDLIFSLYDVKNSKCLYMDEVVKLLKYELDYHPMSSAIIHNDVLKFVPNSEIKPLKQLVTEKYPQVNKYQTNVLLQGHIKSASEMVEYGFRRIEHKAIDVPYWSYYTNLIPKYDIGFYLGLYDDGSIRIDVLDDDFGQPYDYQKLLDNDPYYMFPRKVFWEVDKVMHRLQDDGFISEYHTGMYV